MIGNDYLRLALIVAGSFVLYQVLNKMAQKLPVMNEGTVHVEVSGEDLAGSSPAVSSPDSCPSIARVGMPKRTCHQQVQTLDDPTCDYQMLKNNTNVQFPSI